MLNSCIVGRLILFNFADVNDYKKFPSRSIENGEKKFEFPIAEKGKAHAGKYGCYYCAANL